MNSRWADIAGITVVNEQVKLPCDPNVVLLTFAEAVEQSAHAEGPTKDEIVRSVCANHRADARRIHGLMEWMGQTRVARWEGEEERLALFPGTDVLDLAYRFTAWVGAQSVRGRSAEQAQRFLDGLQTQASMDFRARKPRTIEKTEVQQWVSAHRATVNENTPVAAVGTTTQKLRNLIGAFDESFVERRQIVRAVFLSVLSGQHALLLGPPGTAKSMLARAVCQCFDGATYFEYLLSRFTHPDELFGPVSIPGLKKEDYRRLTEGFLPAAHIGFLDEIFKANSAILNSLLTVVNERVFHHGRHRDDVPLIALVGASNELPEAESGLGALYDRFLVRMVVPPLEGEDGFLKVALGSLPPFEPAAADKLTLSDLAAIQRAAEAVVVPPAVTVVLTKVWKRVRELDWGVSDRRWRQALGMLRVAAATDDRAEVALADLLLLEPVLAPDPSQLASARDLLLEQIRPEAAPTHDLMSQWVLVNGDRVGPVAGLSYSEGPFESPTLEARLALRKASIERFLAIHEQAVAEHAAHRASVEAFGERHLWLERTPVALLEPHIEAARHLARLLKTAEAYRASIASPTLVALRLLSQLPEETKVGPQQFDALAEIEDIGAFGLFNGGWRRVTVAGDVPRLTLSVDQFFNWLGGRITTAELTQGKPGWTGASRMSPLEKIRRAWADLVIPSPGAPPKP